MYPIWVHHCSVPIIGTMKKTISTPEYADLVAWLKDARLALGLSMRDLAERLEEPHSFVQKVEIMEKRLDVYEYAIYCKALQIDPRDGFVFFRQ